MATNEDKPQGTPAYAFGGHAVNGIVAKKTTVGSGNYAQTTVVVILGEGVWESVDSVYWNGGQLEASQYHFHRGNYSSGFAVSADPDTQGLDPWNTNGQTYNGKAYIVVKLPAGVGDDADFSNLKMMCRCKRVPDYDVNGVQTGFSYSTNPARCAMDVLLNKLKLSPSRIDWASYIAYRDFCDELVDWDAGVPSNRPNWQPAPEGYIAAANGGWRKSSGSDAWNGVKTISGLNANLPNYGFFGVEPRQGQTAFGYVDAATGTLNNPNQILAGFICEAASATAINGVLKITASGTTETVGTWARGDHFKVIINNRVAKFFKNNVQITTSILPTINVGVIGAEYLYHVDTTIWQSVIAPLNSGAASTGNIPTWINMLNVGVNGTNGGLIKNAGGSLIWNAGAVTSTTIPANTEGYIEATAGAFAGVQMIGFTDQNNVTTKWNMKFGLQLQGDHKIYVLRNGTDILNPSAFTWATGDTFRVIRKANGAYEVWKNGSLMLNQAILGGANVADTGAIRGAYAAYDQNVGITASTFSHVGSNLRQRKRFECGLAFTGSVDAITALQSILYISCATIQDVDGKLVFITPSMAGRERTSTFTFNMSNIKDGSFKNLSHAS